MIGLQNLPDGGHQLVHPAGPMFVRVRQGGVLYAELAPWGSAAVLAWPAGRLGALRNYWGGLLQDTLKGVVANV